MVLKFEFLSRISLIIVSVAVLMSSAPALADEYRPDEFLKLDLSKAALSPNPLGPANTFGAVPTVSRTDGDGAGRHTHAKPAQRPERGEHVSVAKPRGTAARNRLAQGHRNPMDAQAMDTRTQVWPCKSGAICKWKQ